MQLAALRYAYVAGMAERRAPHRESHLALIERFRADSRLLIAGALGDPPSGGLLIFSDSGAAGDFVAVDPYVEAGLVTAHEIEPWNVVAHGPLPE